MENHARSIHADRVRSSQNDMANASFDSNNVVYFNYMDDFCDNILNYVTHNYKYELRCRKMNLSIPRLCT